MASRPSEPPPTVAELERSLPEGSKMERDRESKCALIGTSTSPRPSVVPGIPYSYGGSASVR
jgi:hypothetical protein